MGGLMFGSGLEAPGALLDQMVGSGGRISRGEALKASAVIRARNLIAGISSTLPLELRVVETREIDDRNWVGVQPNDMIEDTVHYSATFEDLFFEGRSYWRVTGRGADGLPISAEHLAFSSVSEDATLLSPSKAISPDHPFSGNGMVYVDGQWVPSRDIIRFISPQPPLLTYAANAIRSVLLLDRIASEYAANPLPFGYFTDSEDEEPLDDDEIRQKLTAWERARRERMWGYVERGLELNMLEWPSPQQLQLIEARNHAVLEIARFAGLDPEDLATSTEGTSKTYANQEQRRLDLVDFTLMPYLSAVQDRLSMRDVCPPGRVARYRVGAFARADTQGRFESYKLALESKFMTVDEVRRSEGWPDLTDEQREELTPKPVVAPVPEDGEAEMRPPRVPSNGNGATSGAR